MKLRYNETVCIVYHCLNINLKSAYLSIDDTALEVLQFIYFMNALTKFIQVTLLEEAIFDIGNALSTCFKYDLP